MKTLILAGCLIFSVSVFAAEPTTASSNTFSTSQDADIPGTLVPPTQKQLKSIKKPKKEKATKSDTPSTSTSTPTSTPSH